MKCLITGATGLVGNEIVRLCAVNNIEVHYLTTSKSKIVSQQHYKGFYWNPSTGEIDMACFNGVTTVINLAGASISKRWTAAYKKDVLDSRVNSLRTLFNAIHKLEDLSLLTSFVSASGIGVYPNSLDAYYTEDETQIDASFLGDVVKQWEIEIDKFTIFPFSVTTLRTGLVLAPNGGALPEMAKPVNLLVGSAFGSGQQWQSWIHITDLAKMFLFTTKNNLGGIFNAVAPNPISQNKLINAIAKTLEKPLFLPNIPKFMAKLLLGEMAYLLLASQRVSSKKIEEEGFIFKYPTISAALAAIYKNEK